MDTNETGAGIHLAGANVYHAHRWKNTSLSVGMEYANLEPYFRLIPQRTEWTKSPESYSSEFIFRHKFSKKDMLKIYLLGSLSELGMYYHDISNDSIIKNPFKLNNQNFYLNTSYKRICSDKLIIFTGISYAADADDMNQGILPIKTNEKMLQGKFILTRYFQKNHSLKLGAEIQNTDNTIIYDIHKGDIHETYTALFAEMNNRMGSRFASRAGLRMVSSSLSGEIKCAPRISFSYITGLNSQVSVAYGMFYQMPEDSLRYQFNKTKFESAEHLIANYQWTGDERVLRVEGYYKKYQNLFMNTPESPNFNNNGKGYATGIDIFWRDEKTIANSDYWISYSYIDTKRHYRRYPEILKPDFISDHNISLVYKYNIQKLSTTVGGTYTLSSGRTFYVLTASEVLKSETTPYYNNLSFSVSKVASVFGNFAVFYAAVYNVMNREHVFAYRYSPDGNSRLSVGPTNLRSFFVGCFISFR